MPDMFRVFEKQPYDARLKADRHTWSVFPITRFSSREEAEKRREELVFTLRMAAGLYPWPEKTPMQVRREVCARYPGCSVEKIMFETRPGFWSTGNLYLPDPLKGPYPAILNVIGHWKDQRLTRLEEADYPQQLVNFARMGFVCLVPDMIGKVDSRQISHEYGYGEKELWLSNGLGVQLWNNIRALDLLCAMPEVDAGRIGVTGASGGGSQSLFLAMADERIRACAPINMISLRMQGGCFCENAPGLRRNTDNAEMCAMLAPRPLFLAGSTGDWTDQLMTQEYPAMLETYRLYGAEDKVEVFYQVADHQYNRKTRSRVYSFFARHLMGKEIAWEEQDIETGDVWDLTWFRGSGSAPGLRGDQAFFDAFRAERARAAETLSDGDRRRMLAWITGVREVSGYLADGETLRTGRCSVEKTCLVGADGEQIPFLRILPDNWDGKSVCLLLSGAGKDCAAGAKGQKILEGGCAVISGDLFLTGESAGAEVEILGGEPGRKFFTVFHDPKDAQRAKDIALLWREVLKTGSDCFLCALDQAAAWATCVLPLLKNVKKAQLDKAGLSLKSDDDYMNRLNIPGIMNVGGIEGCLKIAGCEVELR